MQTFETSLLREKFVIHDPKTGNKDEKATIALSNRFVVDLRNAKGSVLETYVVRGHNMHTVVRMATRILYAFNQSGPIAKRVPEFDWPKAWDTIINDYEYAYNPQRWVAVYKDGKTVFTYGEYHPFLDMIEKCDEDNDKDYDYAIPLAEQLFKKAGQNLRIEHDSNVALSVNFEDNQGRLGIILRGSNKTTTFSFSATATKKDQVLNIPQCLGAAAAFLEGVQLAFLVGMNIEKIRIGLISRFSKEEKQTREGRQRLARLSTEIANLESAFEVRYRPEKPEFPAMVVEAEELGQKILEPPEKPFGEGGPQPEEEGETPEKKD